VRVERRDAGQQFEGGRKLLARLRVEIDAPGLIVHQTPCHDFRGLFLTHEPPVVGVVPALRVDAARLEELRLTALECLIEGEIDSGQAAAVVGALEALIADHPLREGLYRLLMLALYRSNRQGEALRVVSRLRQVLATDPPQGRSSAAMGNRRPGTR